MKCNDRFILPDTCFWCPVRHNTAKKIYKWKFLKRIGSVVAERARLGCGRWDVVATNG